MILIPYCHNNQCGVYLIKNKITGDCYVGSSVNIYKRSSGHKSKLLANKHSNQHLQNAINKYGIENFCFEILELCDKEEVRKKEGFYITTLKPHYNIDIVLETGVREVAEETRLKIGIKSAEKFINNPELKLKLINSRKDKPVWNKDKINIYSEETLQKMREGAKNRTYSEKHKDAFLKGSQEARERRKKSILQIDMDNNIVKEWSSLKEAANSFNCKSAGNIYSGIKYNKIRYGYYWKYKN